MNDLVKAAERQLTQRLVARVMAKIVLPKALSFLGGPLSWLLTQVVAWLVERGDWITYSLGNSWMNSHDGRKFEEMQNELHALPKDAPKEQVEKRKQDVRDAFDRLFDG